MKSYKKQYPKQTTARLNTAVEGQTLEQKLERKMSQKEKIEGEAPLIFTERKEGIRASTNIRTDRWDVALDAAEKIQKSYKARREQKPTTQKDGKPEPIQTEQPQLEPK